MVVVGNAVVVVVAEIRSTICTIHPKFHNKRHHGGCKHAVYTAKLPISPPILEVGKKISPLRFYWRFYGRLRYTQGRVLKKTKGNNSNK